MYFDAPFGNPFSHFSLWHLLKRTGAEQVITLAVRDYDYRNTVVVHCGDARQRTSKSRTFGYKSHLRFARHERSSARRLYRRRFIAGVNNCQT